MMLIAAGIVISTLILNFGFIVKDINSEVDISASDKNNSGMVLGVEENSQEADSNIFLEFPEDVRGKIEGITADIISLLIKDHEKKFNVDENKEEVPINKVVNSNEVEIIAKSGAIISLNDSTLLFSKDAYKEFPIASITKLMTALVFLDNNPGWDEIYEIKKEDRRDGGKVYLFWGEKVKIKDLFYLSLVGSANTATIALVKSTGLTEEEFVEKMNNKSAQLGFKNTYFKDSTGLDAGNVSSAYEVSLLAKAALSFKDIRKATITKEYSFNTLGQRKVYVHTTDYLLDNFSPNDINIIGGKTGYTEAAGYCFVGEFIGKDDFEVVSAILGSESGNGRFTQTRELVEWAYNNYR